MKKLLSLTVAICFSTFIFAQDAAEKKVQAGLVTGFGMNFQKMGTKLIETNGVGNDLTIGANVIFSFSETIGLCTGVEFDFETLKYKSSATDVYYRYSDATILPMSDGEVGNEMFELETRKQKAVYLTLPTMMMFKTKFIGYFRYFGKFGLRNSFLLSSKINDIGTNFNFDDNPVAESFAGETQAGTNDNMTAKGEMFFFKSAVGLSGGAEWNFTGSTCLMAELGYYYGFTPLHGDRKTEKSYLYTTNATGDVPEYFSNQATQGQLMFKVSILF